MEIVKKEDRDLVCERLNEGLRKIVPEFDISESYYFWSRQNRKFTKEEKKRARAFLEPYATEKWDGSYLSSSAFATLTQMGFKDVPAMGPAVSFWDLHGRNDTYAKVYRKIFANHLAKTLSKVNYHTVSEFLKRQADFVDNSEYWQRFVAKRVLSGAARKRDPEFLWVAQDPRYDDLA